MDDSLASQNFFHTIRSHSRSRQHNGKHAQHQKSHDNLHRILDKCHHIADLHLTFINTMGSRPHYEDRDSIHNKHHDRHHKCHGTVYEQVRLCQHFISIVKALLLMLLCAERPDDPETGKDFPHDQVHLIYQGLKDLKSGHCHQEKDKDDQTDQNDCKADDPGHGHICL